MIFIFNSSTYPDKYLALTKNHHIVLVDYRLKVHDIAETVDHVGYIVSEILGMRKLDAHLGQQAQL